MGFVSMTDGQPIPRLQRLHVGDQQHGHLDGALTIAGRPAIDPLAVAREHKHQGWRMRGSHSPAQEDHV
jgi:hypothetical protein